MLIGNLRRVRREFGNFGSAFPLARWRSVRQYIKTRRSASWAVLGQQLERARRDRGESHQQKIFSPVHMSL
ncbi:hypothetical protein DPMN_181987 [Dreissena polymorpha]|uniref:Uncharacterized protein n=1 Tax=Dreissena polymorpha TaxID=45954 RepID=A0A9D4DFJ0_DREPO|nr:hypothetical protein DPMN_181987 [Dreissena polymorpha]